MKSGFSFTYILGMFWVRNTALLQQKEKREQEGVYSGNYIIFPQVTVKLNNGIRDFSTSVTLKQSLCDGRWHRIAGQ